MKIPFSEYSFEPGAMSIVQMGEELIGHPSTAINELVKNGYDADAGSCHLYIHYHPIKSNSFLIIADDGLGMDSDTLFGDWLQPSKSSKRDEDNQKRRSKIFNRRYLGSKGIGRLAAMALGEKLTVITKQSNEKEYNWISLDREQFKVEELLKEIKFPGGKVSSPLTFFSDEISFGNHKVKSSKELQKLLSENRFNTFSEGTLIIVQELDDAVSGIIEEEFEKEDSLQETSFFKSLRDLITPLQLNSKIQRELLSLEIISKELQIASGESTFEIYFAANLLGESETEKIDFVKVEPSAILDHYDYRVFGKVTDSADVHCRYLCKRIESDPKDEDLIIPQSYVLSDSEEKVRQLDILESPEREQFPGVGEFYFDIRIYDLDGDAKDKIAKVLHASGRREATRRFKQYLGLKISKNGFGIKPYGEEDQDWLGLGALRVQKHITTIGPNQIIGNVFLYSPQNDSLSEKTNREGFFENRAFLTFKKILLGILDKTGRKRADYRLKHNLGRQIRSKLERPDTEKFIQYILNKTSNKSIISASQKFIEETNTALDNMEDSLSFSERLASIGTGLELVFHELSQPISSLGASTYSLSFIIPTIIDRQTRRLVKEEVISIQAATDSLGILQDALRPAIGRTSPRKFLVIETLKKVLFLFEKSFKKDNIEINIKKNLEGFELNSQEYIFWIAFLNLINNSNYWLKQGPQKRVITIELLGTHTIVLSNTSPQIPEEYLERIFEYGVTMKKERKATGLGLAFTRRMLSTIGWEIYAENWDTGPAFYLQKQKKQK